MQGHPTPEKILQTGLAFWASKTLLSAIEMGLFTELAQGGERFETLHARLGLHPRSARDFLDALVSLGLAPSNGNGYSGSFSGNLNLAYSTRLFTVTSCRISRPSPRGSMVWL